MLQNIREGIQGPWAIGIVAVIVVSFVFSGVGGYLASNNSDAVASVNGVDISSTQLENAYQNERQRLQGQYGDAINSLFASESYIEQFKSDVLQRLINDELLYQQATEMGLRVSDEQIKQAITEIAAFQLDGQFSNDLYLSSLARAGFNANDFAELMRKDLTRNQLETALNMTGFALKYQIEETFSLEKQTRSARVLGIDSASFIQDLTVSDEEISNFYEVNLPNYDTQEKVKLSYVTLSIDDLKQNVVLDDAEVLAHYEENISFYTTNEQKEYAHILVELGEQESIAQDKIKSIQDKLAAGESFEALASELSDDFITAEEGGMLGVLETGENEVAFEEAAFSLTEVGQVSEPVETSFGLHLIKLVSFMPAVVSEFDEVRDQIVEELIENKATEKFLSLENQMANVAYAEPYSLEGVAQLIDATIKQTEFFEKGQLPVDIDYPQVEELAFSLEMRDENLNSDVIELTEDVLAVFRVAEFLPQRTLSLEEVTGDIQNTLIQEKAQSKAVQYAQSILEAISNSEDPTALLEEFSLSWVQYNSVARSGSDLPRDVVELIYSLGLSEFDKRDIVNDYTGQIYLVELTDVTETSEVITEEASAPLKQRIAITQAQQSYRNYIDILKSEAEIVVF